MEFSPSVHYFDMLCTARKLYSQFLEPLCRSKALTRNELDVLLFLYNHPGLDRAADVSGGRGIAKSHVSQAVALLEQKQLLERRFDPADRRTAHLALTPGGQAIAREGRDIQRSFFAAVCQGIAPEELALWGSLLERLRENMQQMNP
ncbi:MAG: MarR family winged helix-turn-helix transcriptional regulator [Eubacteriales bacterium]|nr:MarR family winged helix-turn-helix transcriptional regulator [Eubacteriales bacterium]